MTAEARGEREGVRVVAGGVTLSCEPLEVEGVRTMLAVVARLPQWTREVVDGIACEVHGPDLPPSYTVTLIDGYDFIGLHRVIGRMMSELLAEHHERGHAGVTVGRTFIANPKPR